MSGGMPELGSKISLISKADIRYEGRLYTVDPQECTIALSSVRSFGTEDRDTQFQIAPQSQIYDYILFRGSDIKDIRVINNLPHPNDPAIMHVQLQNGQQIMPQFPMPNMNTPAPQMAPGSYPFGGMGGGLGAIGGGAGSSGAVGNAMASGSSGPASFMMGNQQQQQQQQTQQQQQKPQQTQHKPPSEMHQPDRANQQEPQLPLASTQGTEELKKVASDHPTSTTKLGHIGCNNLTIAEIVSGKRIGTGLLSSVIGGGGGLVKDIHAIGNCTINPCSSSASASTKNLLSNVVALNELKDQDMLTGGSRSTTPISLISRKSPSAEIGVQVNQQQQQQHHNQMQHHSNQNNAGHGPNGGNKRQNQQQPQQRSGNNQQRNDFYHQQRSGGRIQNNQQQQHPQQQQHHEMRNNFNNQRSNNQGGAVGGPNRNWTMHRGVPNNMMMRNRGGGRGRMQNQVQGFRQMGVPGMANQNKPRVLKSTIKFEQDFDFEQANNKFEELRSQLAKLKVGEEPKTEQINGETDKKDDSGNETGAGDHEHEDDEITVGYDKTKSFFDNISCETAQDRSKNKKNDWRQERKLNSETFGVSSTRRGSYRGRNNYYNRSLGNFNGGGNRGYRPGMNYRNRNNNNNRNNVGAASGASRDSNNGDVNFEAPNNNNATNTNATKNQPAEQQRTSSVVSAASGGNTATGANPLKPTPQQSNTNNQPQVAAVGE